LKEGGDLVEVDASIARSFEVHGKDTHDYRLLIGLRGLLLVPQAWYFRMDGICAGLSL
jgi:hypothetical protein